MVENLADQASPDALISPRLEEIDLDQPEVIVVNLDCEQTDLLGVDNDDPMGLRLVVECVLGELFILVPGSPRGLYVGAHGIPRDPKGEIQILGAGRARGEAWHARSNV